MYDAVLMEKAHTIHQLVRYVPDFWHREWLDSHAVVKALTEGFECDARMAADVERFQHLYAETGKNSGKKNLS